MYHAVIFLGGGGGGGWVCIGFSHHLATVPPSIDKVVTLKDIQLIKYKPPDSKEVKSLRADRTLSCHWERLATAFDIEHNECEAIRQAKLQDPARCLSEVINRWLTRKGRMLTTWNHFLRILRDDGLETEAGDIEKALQYRI